MSYSGFAYPSLLLSAFTAVALCALPAQAQAPRPGQLAPGPGQPLEPARSSRAGAAPATGPA